MKREVFHITGYILLTFGFIWLIRLIPMNIPILDPLNDQIGQYDINDRVFSQLRDHHSVGLDTNLVIINSETNDRIELSKAIEKLDSLGTKVVGFDILLDSLKGEVEDSLLKNSIQGSKVPIVFGDIITDGKIIAEPHSFFEIAENTAYCNFSSHESFAVRAYSPFLGLDEHFTSKIIKFYNRNTYKQLYDRGCEREWINFRRKQGGEVNHIFPVNQDSIDKYMMVNITDFLKEKNEDIHQTYRNKIVLIGYCGDSDKSISMKDRFITPLNEYPGRTIPDMHGVFVHANILSMIISDDYIYDVPSWLVHVLSFIILMAGYRLFEKYPFDGSWKVMIYTRAIQLGLLFILCTMFSAWLLNHLNIKLPCVLLATIIIISHEMYEFYHGYFKKHVDRLCDHIPWLDK
jgi:CHASE2 domain-containing sensor protein